MSIEDPNTPLPPRPETGNVVPPPEVHSPAQLAPSPFPGSRRRRRWWWAGGSLIFLLAATYVVLTHPLVMGQLVLWQLGSIAGGKVVAENASVSRGGRVVLKNATLRVADIKGKAGSIFESERIEARVDFSALLFGGRVVDSIEVIHPVIRLSQNVDTGKVNVTSLDPRTRSTKKPGKPAAAPLAPQVKVTEGVIEIGEHTSTPGSETFTLLKRVDFEGEVISALDNSGDSIILFRQPQTPGQPPRSDAITIRGTAGNNEIKLKISGLSLAEYPAEALPTPLREPYRNLNLRGDIASGELTYRLAPTPGLEATIELVDVGLDLPLSPRPGVDKDDRVIPVPEELKDRRLHMRKTKGKLTITDKGMKGELDGLLEELPYNITFDIDGRDENSAFTAHLKSTGFELTESPGIAIFAPGVVRRRLEQFSNPTGTVDADVIITRGQPNESIAAQVAVNGTLKLRNGSAAFERFPYRFYNLSVDAVFNDSKLLLNNMRGDTPDGATVLASAVISPLTDDAGVVVDVTVKGLPVNATLAAAMKQRGAIIDVLFNDAHYKRLLEQGLVRAPGSVSQDASIPEFVPGGAANVVVKVTRVEGSESIWNDIVDIHFERVGLLPEAFPYPMLAEDIRILKVDYDATVSGGIYRGLRGGEATLSAKCDLEQLDKPGAPFVPILDITSKGIPADNLLRFALPEAASLSPDGRPLRDLIHDLYLSGTGDATIKIWQLYGDDADSYGTTGYDIAVAVDGMGARPQRSGPIGTPRAASGLSLSGITGRLEIKHSSLAIAIDGTVSAPSSAPVQRASPFGLRASMTYAPRSTSARGEVDIDVSVADADVTLPAQEILSLVAPDVSADYILLRSQLNPSGRVDFSSRITRQPTPTADVTPPTAALPASPQQMIATTRLSRPMSLAFDLQGSRAIISSTDVTQPCSVIIHHSGTPPAREEPPTQVGLTSQPRAQLEFDKAALHVESLDGPVGNFVISGILPLSLLPHSNQPLSVAGTDVRLESSLVRALVRSCTSDGLADYISNSQLSGLLQFQITAGSRAAMAPGTAAPLSATPESWLVRGELIPSQLGVVLAATPIALPQTKGSVTFTERSGVMNGLEVFAPSWKATINGTWDRPADGSLSTDHLLSLQAASLSPDLVAVFPEVLRKVFTDLALKIDGPLSTNNISLQLTYDAQSVLQSFKTSGQILASELSLDAGVKVTHAALKLDFEASRSTPAVPDTYNAWAWCESLRAADIHITNGKLRLTSGEGTQAGALIIPHFSGDCHGGRLSGDAIAHAAPSGENGTFDARAQGSSLRFASVLADFRAKSDLVPNQPDEPDTTPDGSRGLLDFGVTLTGTSGDTASRRGRGTASVTGGKVLSLPLVVPLVRMTNLQLPVSEKLSYAQADFFLQGDTLQFEQAWISSPGVDLIGYGTMELPTLTVDARVRGKSKFRIPVISKVMDSLRDELFTARITGPASNLTFGFESFSGASRLIDRLIGTTPSEADEKLRFIEKNADLSPKRPREVLVEAAEPTQQPPGR